MHPGQIAAKPRPRQHGANDDVPQRVADEAVDRRQTAFTEMYARNSSGWLEKQRLQRCRPLTLQYLIIERTVSGVSSSTSEGCYGDSF